METLVSGARYKGDHFHDASKHGLFWGLLNELLHVIVFIYTLYGMIQFKVKFIRRPRLVRMGSLFIIAHSWYLTLKFATIAATLYLFNDELEARNITWAEFNCSLANQGRVFRDYHQRTLLTRLGSSANGTTHSTHSTTTTTSQTFTARLKFVTDYFYQIDYPQWYASFLEQFGGPFKLMGNRSTLMYGFYAIALYIMLAIFPLELMYLKVGFNYIRFVLSDTSCMSELYLNRQRHLNRLTSWSRNQTDSELTLGSKIALNQRDLRIRYADDCNELAVQLVLAHMAPTCLTTQNAKQTHHKCRRQQRPKVRQSARLAATKHKLAADVKPLRPRLAINHLEAPSYCVKVAQRNLAKFKPFVRSESWFKFAMIIYPIFIFFYFFFLCVVVGTVSIFFHFAFRSLSESCQLFASPAGNPVELWSHWDCLLFFETQYTVIAISCASSFYCSYYFGTILELYVWVKEISQQLDLCKIIIEIFETDSLNYLCHSLLDEAEVDSDNAGGAGGAGGPNNRLNNEQVFSKIIHSLKQRQQTLQWANCFHGDHRQQLKQLKRNQSKVLNCVNDFGGLSNFWTYWALAKCSGQAKQFKALELMAIKLLNKKQTLLRATYINMCLFFDELNDTRLMTRIILRRTTQIVFGFAIMASLTRSQFQANYWHLTLFLGACLIILNWYLACAAIINSSVNKLLVQVHSLISASLRASSEDADLFEFWVRHIRSFGEDRDVMSYKIYGYKITWATILNFDSAVCTAYFYTIY